MLLLQIEPAWLHIHPVKKVGDLGGPSRQSRTCQYVKVSGIITLGFSPVEAADTSDSMQLFKCGRQSDATLPRATERAGLDVSGLHEQFQRADS